MASENTAEKEKRAKDPLHGLPFAQLMGMRLVTPETPQLLQLFVD